MKRNSQDVHRSLSIVSKLVQLCKCRRMQKSLVVHTMNASFLSTKLIFFLCYVAFDENIGRVSFLEVHDTGRSS